MPKISETAGRRMIMGNYRKKPVEIEAFKLGVDCIPDWFMDAVTANEVILHGTSRGFDHIPDTNADIHTLEGWHHANYGDYIIRGVKGELYPCKPDIFDMTYEAVNGEKTKADRIRAMSDKELAVFLADKVPHGDCCDCRLGCIWADKGEFESSCQNAWYEWLMLPADQDENVDLPKVGKWVFWDGWVSNHDLRIEDAVCSECGYRHPTVRLEEGYPTVEEARAAVLGKLAKECPRCGAKMIGGDENVKE